MKEITSNQIFDFKNKFISALKQLAANSKRVSFIIVFSLSIVNISAQNGSAVTPTVMDVKAYISSLKNSNQRTKASASSSQYIENIVFGIQPGVYYYSDVPKTYGDIPIKLFTDISSIKNISTANILKNDIEIVVIEIKNSSDLNTKIDLLKFSDFSKLKYIYILSSVNTTDQNIANMFLNYNNQYSIFYKIEIAE